MRNVGTLPCKPLICAPKGMKSTRLRTHQHFYSLICKKKQQQQQQQNKVVLLKVDHMPNKER